MNMHIQDWNAGQPLAGPGMPVSRNVSAAAAAAAAAQAQQTAAMVVDDVDGTDADAEDNKRYCFCKGVSYGEMVACDGEACEGEWVRGPVIVIRTPADVIIISVFSSIILVSVSTPRRVGTGIATIVKRSRISSGRDVVASGEPGVDAQGPSHERPRYDPRCFNLNLPYPVSTPFLHLYYFVYYHLPVYYSILLGLFDGCDLYRSPFSPSSSRPPPCLTPFPLSSSVR
jgi:hypothetical protein